MNSFPICVIVYLTNYCYLTCNHCFLKQINQLNTEMLNFNKLKGVLGELKNNGVCLVAYTGGDPLLHPKLFEILKLTSDLDMLPLLGISGMNVSSKTCKYIYKSGVRCVQIGLNGGSATINNKYRGEKSFESTNKTIKLLKENNINVNVSFCIDKNNYMFLDDMLNYSLKNNIYKVKIEFWENIGIKSDNELNNYEKSKVYFKCMNFMKQNKKKDWIQCQNKTNSNLNRIRNNAIVIMPNGDVKSSEFGKKYGNIYDDTIVNIIKRRD